MGHINPSCATSAFALAGALAFLFLGLQQSIAVAEPLRKSSFPRGFIFGASTSAYQIEGSTAEGGRGTSTWDAFSHLPGKIDDGSNGDIATDSYHRYKDDVKMLKDLGMSSYRFSISWSRVLPQGTVSGGINEEGIQYYHNLIDEILTNGIEPFVTLFHWDVPQALESKYNGFLQQQIVEDFAGYADLCFREFGGKVKYWITLNEPWTFALKGYNYGVHAPGRCSDYAGNCSEGNSATEPYIVGHNLILAHGSAVQIYKNKYQQSQKGLIGITLNTQWVVPYSGNITDRKAAQRNLDFTLGWFMSPIVEGHYPNVMRRLVQSRLPALTSDQVKLVKGSYDFIGLNYYTANYASDVAESPNSTLAEWSKDMRVYTTYERNGVPIGEKAASSWLYIYPQGLRELLLYTKTRYRNPPVFVTENGVDEENNKSWSLEEALNDTLRVRYHSEHLHAVKEAMDAGADVRGYFAWSLLDNFEWENGYTVRFGVYYVDFNNGTLNRCPKASAQWFRDFLEIDSATSSAVALL
eukprot:TRINITY_DN3637_c0_g1_i5.p1 TRINITY_DN3637_c0_g1~~TRINITY_DN3637_c0_g1_i5.p1  ORF type:complete len:524 (+),score=34.51 TRINITY_DN3637_c0_g1_i5:57-1628(+)